MILSHFRVIQVQHFFLPESIHWDKTGGTKFGGIVNQKTRLSVVARSFILCMSVIYVITVLYYMYVVVLPAASGHFRNSFGPSSYPVISHKSELV